MARRGNYNVLKHYIQCCYFIKHFSSNAVLFQHNNRQTKKGWVQGCHAPPVLSPALTPPPPTPNSLPMMMFFPPGVQRLSCPQHVLVLGSSAAKTCDDRVYEHRGVSGVKCVYRGGVAHWKHTLPPGYRLREAIGCIYWQRKNNLHIQRCLLTDKLCSLYCFFNSAP